MERKRTRDKEREKDRVRDWERLRERESERAREKEIERERERENGWVKRKKVGEKEGRKETTSAVEADDQKLQPDREIVKESKQRALLTAAFRAPGVVFGGTDTSFALGVARSGQGLVFAIALGVCLAFGAGCCKTDNISSFFSR